MTGLKCCIHNNTTVIVYILSCFTEDLMHVLLLSLHFYRNRSLGEPIVAQPKYVYLLFSVITFYNGYYFLHENVFAVLMLQRTWRT